MKDYKDQLYLRLKILNDGGVIDEEVKYEGERFVDYLFDRYEGLSLHALETFITHYVMARQRVKNGENIEMMDESLLRDIKENDHYEESKEILEEIEDSFKIQIPETEEMYLLIHLSNILATRGEV